jgi:hypothetical protein
MSESQKAAVRSFVITFVVALVPLLAADDVDWSVKGLVAIALAALRTAVSAAVPGGTYGHKAK